MWIYTYGLATMICTGLETSESFDYYSDKLEQIDIYTLDCRGIIIVPGSEGFRLMHPSMTKKKHKAIADLAQLFKSNQAYPKELLEIVNPNETLSKRSQIGFNLMAKLGLTNLYWNSMLKKNHAYDKRFDAPYTKEPIKATAKGYIKNY